MFDARLSYASLEALWETNQQRLVLPCPELKKTFFWQAMGTSIKDNQLRIQSLERSLSRDLQAVEDDVAGNTRLHCKFGEEHRRNLLSLEGCYGQMFKSVEANEDGDVVIVTHKKTYSFISGALRTAPAGVSAALSICKDMMEVCNGAVSLLEDAHMLYGNDEDEGDYFERFEDADDPQSLEMPTMSKLLTDKNLKLDKIEFARQMTKKIMESGDEEMLFSFILFTTTAYEKMEDSLFKNMSRLREFSDLLHERFLHARMEEEKKSLNMSAEQEAQAVAESRASAGQSLAAKMQKLGITIVK